MIFGRVCVICDDFGDYHDEIVIMDFIVYLVFQISACVIWVYFVKKLTGNQEIIVCH
jgi:hypothetical protein